MMDRVGINRRNPLETPIHIAHKKLFTEVGLEGIYFYILKVFYFKLFFLFLNCFNVLILKIIFKK